MQNTTILQCIIDLNISDLEAMLSKLESGRPIMYAKATSEEILELLYPEKMSVDTLTKDYTKTE